MVKDDPTNYKEWDISDERTFYNPTFFTKVAENDVNGKKRYSYTPKKSSDGSQLLYWEKRQQKNWDGVPRIYEDDCEVFY